ncbi:MAG: HDIG domain-containing metalloprotein [Candidatus Omnitrophota bacterium]
MKKQAKKILGKTLLYLLSFIVLIAFSILAQINIILTFLLIALFAYLKITESRKVKKTNILHLGFLFVLGISSAMLLEAYSNFSPYYIPVPAITMLTVILFANLELALIISCCLSIFVGFIFQNDIFLLSIMFLGSMTGASFVYKIRQRHRIIQAGILVSFVMVLSLVVISYRKEIGIMSFATSPNVLSASINGILSAFIIAGSLPIFEFLFKVVTNISLLELSDFNHSLLKRMVLEAPGTYHHSLLVGNLAEIAAESIDANALLARVGAYYHDIGKLEKPEYFSENQDRSLSKHDQLKASMSKLVIINHVKEGVTLAKKHKLNSAIREFIEQHHGTSLVFYFYRRALEESKKKEDVQEEIFRYTGPKPQSKETAIVLLADSVEAACRALDSPNAQRIEEVVHTIINNKFIDGQLDECDLTLRDLNKIDKTFIHILSAIYHSRIEYPEIKSESNNKGSSEKNQDKSDQDKKNSS